MKTKTQKEEKTLKNMAALSGADGWELISTAEYQQCTQEEIDQLQKEIKADVEKMIENL